VTGEHIALDADGIARIVRRVATEIVERTRNTPRLGLIGIRRGGVPIAGRIAQEIGRTEGRTVPVGAIDITLYRDDAASALPDPKVGPSEIDFAIDGWDVVLVDDVLHTGRTVRAAIDHLLDYGRPRRVWLAVLCDRGVASCRSRPTSSAARSRCPTAPCSTWWRAAAPTTAR
jgi:pyrimidine operon attenuation protein/uracil phosphoribosyltransferase